MTCPHIGPWFRIGGRRPIRQQCGLTKRACRPLDACPAEMGEWGAWRSVVGWFTPENVWFRYFGIQSGRVYVGIYMKAVGWSP